MEEKLDFHESVCLQGNGINFNHRVYMIEILPQHNICARKPGLFPN